MDVRAEGAGFTKPAASDTARVVLGGDILNI